MEKSVNWKNIYNCLLNLQKKIDILHEGKLSDIIGIRVTRTGLEFANFFVHKNLKSVVLWGNDEFKYLSQFNTNEIKQKIEKIMQLNPPLIVLSISFIDHFEILKELAKKYNITVITTSISSADLTNHINWLLAELLSEEEFLHANLLKIYGFGVLITGKSGLGKSEVTLELLKKSHMFVADDAVICKKIYGKIIGKAPENFYGFIEVRGLGVVNVERIFGIEKMEKSTPIDIWIEIEKFNPSVHTYERLGKEIQYKKIMGVKIPYYLLPISSGKKTSDLIEITVAQLKLIQSGYNSFDEFIKKSKKEDYE